MLTEDDARALLRAAADEVPVGPPRFDGATAVAAAPRKRRWLLLAVSTAIGMVIGGVVAHLQTSPPDPPTVARYGHTISLSTGDWEAGSASGGPIEGQLLSRDGCLFLQTPGGPVDVAWPERFSAVQLQSTVELRDAEGTAVARLGQWVEADTGKQAYEGGLVCTAAQAAVEVRSDVRTGEVPAGWPTMADFDLAHRFTSFAVDPREGVVVFDYRLVLGVGSSISARPGPQHWFQPRAWEIRADDEAGGRLSPLWQVQSLGSAYRLTTERETCGDGPLDATPARLRGYRVLSLQPPRAESCDGWFAVDLYLAPGVGERIHGVMLRR